MLAEFQIEDFGWQIAIVYWNLAIGHWLFVKDRLN